MIRAFLLDELVLLNEAKIVEGTHQCYHGVISVVITNCCRNGKKKISSWPTYPLSLSWLGIFRIVVVVSVIQDVTVVTRKEEDGRETIVDQ